MAPVKSSAVVLRGYRLGETSRVVVCYTRAYGKVRLVAKGVRKGGGRLGAALEPMLVSGVVFYLKEGRDLSLVSHAEIEREFAPLRRDVVRLAYASAVVELVDLLVSERESDPALFDFIVNALGRMASAPRPELDPILWLSEIGLARALGYAPELSRCVACGGPSAPDPCFSPELGGLVCQECVRDAGRSKLWCGRGVEVLVDLVRSGDTGAASGLDAQTRDDVAEMLREFLEIHAGRGLKLKSMRFLAQIRRVELSGEQNGKS